MPTRVTIPVLPNAPRRLQDHDQSMETRMSEPPLCSAARAADLLNVRALLAGGADPRARDSFGFTALHCAALACNRDWVAAQEVMRALLQAGAEPDAQARDGRSVLYLAAEFSPALDPVQLLVAAGANPDVCDAHGNHVVLNALAPAVQAWLAERTGQPMPEPELKFREVRLDGSAWRALKPRLDAVFAELGDERLLVMQDVGSTQDDGFIACSEAFEERQGDRAGIVGFCFYTRQDLNRAKRSSLLPLAFWAAPDGARIGMIGIGQRIVEAFRRHGFSVNWNGSATQRPTVYLQMPG